MSIDPSALEDVARELEELSDLCGAPSPSVPYEVWLSDPDGNPIIHQEPAERALARLFNGEAGTPEKYDDAGGWLVTLPLDVIYALHEHRCYDTQAGGYSITIELP